MITLPTFSFELFQDRAFLALLTLVTVCVIDLMRMALTRTPADPRPVLEQLCDLLLAPIMTRLNKKERSARVRAVRGGIITLFALVTIVAVDLVVHPFVARFGYSAVFQALVLMGSLTALGWLVPLRALAAILADPKAPRPYIAMARASYSSLVPLDDAGMIRHAVGAALRAVIFRLITPLFLFIVGGVPALLAYMICLVIAMRAGADSGPTPFATLAVCVVGVCVALPMVLSIPLALLVAALSAGASFFRALPSLFSVRRWPLLLEGSLPLLVMTYALHITLGGPRQTLDGEAIAGHWIGPKAASARLEPRDLARAGYAVAVSVFLVVLMLYIVSAGVSGSVIAGRIFG